MAGKTIKLLTLCLLERDGQVLLGMKKRGFGEGKWNGYGGKKLPDETIESAAKREALEESGVTINTLEPAGVVEFLFTHEPDIIREMHVFRVTDFAGEPHETEEMAPRWFTKDQVPYGEMWDADKAWMPLVIGGQSIKARFLYDEDGQMLKQDIREVVGA